MRASYLLLLTVCITGCDRNTATIDYKYESNCSACHKTGRINAPISKSNNDWAARTKDINVLVRSVTEGKGGMPVMGGCYNCTNEELRIIIKTKILP